VTRQNASAEHDGKEADKKEAGRSPLRPAQPFTNTTTGSSGAQTVTRGQHFRHTEKAGCEGCGVVTELLQQSNLCFRCTYDPPCLCTGYRWRTGNAEE
jgi:hypothetical protein